MGSRTDDFFACFLSYCFAYKIPALLVASFIFLWPAQAHSNSSGISFNTVAHATTDIVSGELLLENHGDVPLSNVEIVLVGADKAVVVAGPRRLVPGDVRTIEYKIASHHTEPGSYHLLVTVAYQNEKGLWKGVHRAFQYQLGNAGPSGRIPHVKLHVDNLRWRLGGLPEEQVSVRINPVPSWKPVPELNATNTRILLQKNNVRAALPGRVYPQLARLSWIDGGFHHSSLIPFSIRTDQQGDWLGVTENMRPRPFWRSPDVLRAISIGLFAVSMICFLITIRARKTNDGFAKDGRLIRYAGWLVAILLSLWLADHTRLDLWLLPTWTSGGDTASHILYARVFQDWIAQGKISGWMPEVFMGFPAFRYYFPMPFVLGATLAGVIGLPVAFKFIAMLPAILLPLGTYAMGSLLRWPVTACLLGAVGALGFVITTSTSIWGGNLLAQLAGEFAYSWGFLWAVLFWGVLGWALREGGQRWILAALMEVLVAFSHGYALLTAGFGAFLFPLLYRSGGTGLRTVCKVHALAFMLLGFWIIPLISNLPWTIPNDTSVWVDSWKTLWPKVLWPLALGIPALVVVLVIDRKSRAHLGFPLGVAVFGMMAFHVVSHLGLADIRFFPYAQWGAAVSLAAAVGWALYRWVPVSSLWTLAIVVSLLAWWEPQIEKIEHWSKWNLEGYEPKSRWPTYRSIADVTKGKMEEPRVVFEHDPDNNDLGSTRTLEALPLFGTRPVLEGLYMESSISSPFIYQLQSEISSRPSSPLSRFPSTKGGVDSAVGHMQELYTDTLILRSEVKKKQFLDDPRFEVLATLDPFVILRLKEFQSGLVEVIDIPIVSKPREEWMNRAFKRFRLSFPYTEREVYVTADETLNIGSRGKSGVARVMSMGRERLVFETDAIGQPHIIRMTYHPKWKARSGESVYLVEPAFMLIVPQQHRIELVYDQISADRIGAWLTIFGVVILGWLAISGRASIVPVKVRSPVIVVVALVVVGAGSIGMWGWWANPERVYKRGHDLRQEQRWPQAAREFDLAYQGREVPGRKAEALFWAARSLEFGDMNIKALERYRSLVELYPENYWAPESLYRVVLLEHTLNYRHKSLDALAELQKQYPHSTWTKRAIRESGEWNQ